MQTLGFQEANETYNEYLKQSIPDDTRTHHGGTLVQVDGPTSTKKIE